MEALAETVFWVAGGVLLYVFAGYPLVLWVFGRVRRPAGPAGGEYTPSVSMVIAVYRGAGIIQQKIANCLATDYPADRFEVLIGVDGSLDP